MVLSLMLEIGYISDSLLLMFVLSQEVSFHKFHRGKCNPNTMVQWFSDVDSRWWCELLLKLHLSHALRAICPENFVKIQHPTTLSLPPATIVDFQASRHWRLMLTRCAHCQRRR